MLNRTDARVNKSWLLKLQHNFLVTAKIISYIFHKYKTIFTVYKHMSVVHTFASANIVYNEQNYKYNELWLDF